MDLGVLIKEYFNNCKVMQLATVNNGQPWICTVYFVADDQMNIYWTSVKNRQHSKEIKSHPQVATTIVKDIERKQALQMIGEAYEVDESDLERVNALYGAKFGDKPQRLIEVRSGGPDSRAYWVFKPSSIFLWDEVNFPNNPKQEFSQLS